jgi:hypothetical protein
MPSPEEIARSRLQLSVRRSLANGYTLVHSRSAVDLSLSYTVKDFRAFELEKIEGPEVDGIHLIRHTNITMSDKEMVEAIRGMVLDAIRLIRSHEDLVTR